MKIITLALIGSLFANSCLAAQAVTLTGPNGLQPAVKAGSTAAQAADPSLVVQFSPNSGLTAHIQGWDGSAWQNINTNLVAGVYSLDVYDSQVLAAVTGSIPGGSNTIGTVNAAGVTGSGTTLTENPLANGCRAALSTPTAVTDGQKVSMQCGAEGRVITKPYSIKENDLAGAANTTGTSATTIIAAQGASVKIYITGLQCFRTDGGTTMDFVVLNDSAATPEALPPTGGTNVVFQTPLVVAANTALTFAPNASVTTAYCSAQGYKGP